MDLVTHALSGAALGAACAPTPREQLALAIVGAGAGMAPDLDALCGLRGKVAAWRYHRVLLHGLPTIPLQAGALYAVAQWLTPVPLDATLLAAVIVGALLLHLLLDTLTSFGTALGYPFTRRRFSTHSHFIVDPVFLVLLAGSLALREPATGLALGALWLTLGVALRRQVLRRQAHGAAPACESVLVEPGPLAPFRWLTIVRKSPTASALAATSWRGDALTAWEQVTTQVDPRVQQLACTNPLVRVFLDTVDAPAWTVLEQHDGGGCVLLVEDLKWRVCPPLRPLAFQVDIEPQRQTIRVRQMPMHWRLPAAPDFHAAKPGRPVDLESTKQAVRDSTASFTDPAPGGGHA